MDFLIAEKTEILITIVLLIMVIVCIFIKGLK